MEKLKMCRICLVQNVRMHVVADLQLQEMFERLNNIPFVTADSRPVLVCSFCYARLRQCSRFMTKCWEADQVFTRILNEDYEPKPLTYQKGYFGGFIRTSIENIDIVGGDHDEVPVKVELPDHALRNGDIYGTQENYSDETPVEKKPNLDILKEKLRDTIPNNRTEDRQADSKDIDQTQNNENDTVPKLQPHSLSNITIPAPGNIIVFKEENNCGNTKIINETNNPNVCNIKVNQTEHLKIDIPKKQTAEKRFKCDLCQNSFREKSTLHRHILRHTGEKSYKCNICHSSFNNKGNLNRHVRTHTGEKPYHCHICQSSFTEISQLHRHVRTHTGEKPYKCNICHNSFGNKGNLNRHIRKHTGEKPYRCDICTRSFSDKSTLIRHSRTHSGEKPYKCDICMKSFYDKAYLDAHVRMHNGENPYHCDICQSSFTNNSHLVRHIRTHTGEKPYQCDICKKSFIQRGNLRTHIRTHTGEKPYQCHICQSSFARQNNLKIHIRTHTLKAI